MCAVPAVHSVVFGCGSQSRLVQAAGSTLPTLDNAHGAKEERQILQEEGELAHTARTPCSQGTEATPLSLADRG